MLEIKNLIKHYGKFVAVDDLSLTIQKGGVFGFVGPNGAGKTTTMKIMAGLMGATSGEIFIEGIEAIKNPKLIKEKIGYMPDFFGVYDNLKVSEYMDFYAGTYYIAYEKRNKIIDELLETVNLLDKKDTYVDVLSRGMKQRLCLARSLIHNPEILILDEPASGLDPRARVEMKNILKDLKEKGKTILISSHILPELAQMCTEVGIMDKGKLIMQGTMEDMLRHLTQNKKISISILERPEELKRFLQLQGFEPKIMGNNINLEFDFSGTDEELAVLLKEAVEEKFLIFSFKEESVNLEEVFMKVTGGLEI